MHVSCAKIFCAKKRPTKRKATIFVEKARACHRDRNHEGGISVDDNLSGDIVFTLRFGQLMG